MAELVSGLSVLCGGTTEDRIESAFSMFDLNGDGCISLEEMTTYFTSVFRVMREINGDDSHGFSVEELGRSTALDCFLKVRLSVCVVRLSVCVCVCVCVCMRVCVRVCVIMDVVCGYGCVRSCMFARACVCV